MTGIASLMVMGGVHAQENTTGRIIVHSALGMTPPIPVHVSGFSGEAQQVIEFDLHVQGFSLTNAQNATFHITGSNSGNLQGRVFDPNNRTTLVSKSYTGASLRRQAHAFIDDFMRALNRIPIGHTKIAFKAEGSANSEIYVADFDGFNAQAVTQDSTISAAPAWVPGKLAIYYTSYKFGNPNILFHDLASGQRRQFAKYPGLNSSAAVSADGSKVAMILSKGGSPDVYVSNADGSDLRRLTTTREDESSPTFSPDGQWICFATRINERRSLAKVRTSGGPVQRVDTSGVFSPTEPEWSPDGRWIAFTAQSRAGFQICVIPAEGGTATILVEGEDPSWSPNSRTLIFTRRQGGRRFLSLLDVPTKQYKDISRISGSSSQPAWAK